MLVGQSPVFRRIHCLGRSYERIGILYTSCEMKKNNSGTVTTLVNETKCQKI